MKIEKWRELLNPYELAVSEIQTKFEHLRKEHQDKGFYSPIEQVEGRVKKISSILDKCNKKGVRVDEIPEKIEDIAGIRIICQFVEDIQGLAEMIRMRSDMKVKTEKDYISDVKESGYRSYHMIVWYTVDMIEGPRKIMVEIQIRTMAMNFWATIEHSLQYKYKMHMPPEINERLFRVADATEQLDKEMSQVRLEIMDAQNAFSRQARVVAEILNTIQNLYKVLGPEEMQKIQQDFYGIYAQNNIQHLEYFLEILDQKAEDFCVQT